MLDAKETRMGQSRKVVEINGRTYDATTGQPLATSAPKVKPATKPKQPQFIDGLRKSAASAPAAKPAARRAQPHQAKAVHRTAQPSKTLHRAAARKVAPTPAAQPAAVSRPSVLKRSAPAVYLSNQARAERANKHHRSKLISKFGSSVPSQPEHVIVPDTSPEPALASDQPAGPHGPLRAKRQKKWRPKLSSVAAGTLGAFILAGYLAYINIPNITMRIAANRAGFDAGLPQYAPAGFSFDGPIAYSKGLITLQFASNTDERDFQITQRESSWDSQSLLDNFVAKQNRRYLTFQERGLTVYIYNGSEAAWVDGGVWYTIEGDSQLSSEQLLRIAASL